MARLAHARRLAERAAIANEETLLAARVAHDVAARAAVVVVAKGAKLLGAHVARLDVRVELPLIRLHSVSCEARAMPIDALRAAKTGGWFSVCTTSPCFGTSHERSRSVAARHV